MSINDKIIRDHEAKSNQVKKLKRKLKNKISLGRLQQLLAQEKNLEIKGFHYQGLYGYDEEGYKKDVTIKEARIELLEELVGEHK